MSGDGKYTGPNIKGGTGDELASSLFLFSSESNESVTDVDLVDTDDAIDLEIDGFVPATEKPLKTNAQLFDLGEAEYNLSTPLLITIEEYFDEEVVIAHFPELEVFGEGKTEPEAISNLKNEILDLYDDLMGADPDELGRTPLIWLRILSQIITHGG